MPQSETFKPLLVPRVFSTGAGARESAITIYSEAFDHTGGDGTSWTSVFSFTITEATLKLPAGRISSIDVACNAKTDAAGGSPQFRIVINGEARVTTTTMSPLNTLGAVGAFYNLKGGESITVDFQAKHNTGGNTITVSDIVVSAKLIE